MILEKHDYIVDISKPPLPSPNKKYGLIKYGETKKSAELTEIWSQYMIRYKEALNLKQNILNSVK